MNAIHGPLGRIETSREMQHVDAPVTVEWQAIPALEHRPVLMRGVDYDIQVIAEVEGAARSGQLQVAVYIDDEVGAPNAHDVPTSCGLMNAHSRTVRGTGQAIRAGVVIRKDAAVSDVCVSAGTSALSAIPRMALVSLIMAEGT